MKSPNNACRAHATGRHLPANRTKLIAKLAEIDDDIAAIRTQLAAADLERQASKTPIDARWFHKANTALRHFRQERREVLARLAGLPHPKERLKDCLIAVARAQLSPEVWQVLVDAAHAKLAGRDV